MIERLWETFATKDFSGCLRLIEAEMSACSGIDLIHLTGLSLLAMRHFDEGIVLLKAALIYRPSTPEMYRRSAQVVAQLEMGPELQYFIEVGLRAFPNDESLTRLIGTQRLLAMDYVGAKEFYEAKIAADPTDFWAHLCLAHAYNRLENLRGAEYHYLAAYKLNPANVQATNGLAGFYGIASRTADAIQLLSERDDTESKYLLSMYLLGEGDYERGWKLHLYRHECEFFQRKYGVTRPFERLADCAGRRVAIVREGGYGDMLQFFRYIPMLAAHAAEVMVQLTPSETRLYHCNRPANVTLGVAQTDIPECYDYSVSLCDLPYHFRTSVDTIPYAPYLKVPSTAIEERRLPHARKPYRVGLAWAGEAATSLNERAYDARRSIPLAALARFAELESIEWINLQVGTHANDQGLAMTQVLDASCDWLDTAAIVSQLDLVITVDTSIVHLAGAMGCPTWLLSRTDCCWRWLRNRPDCPWYPHVVRVFGQTTFNDWTQTTDDVLDELKRWSRR